MDKQNIPWEIYKKELHGSFPMNGFSKEIN